LAIAAVTIAAAFWRAAARWSPMPRRRAFRDATRRIAAQTRQRLTGQTPDGATRRVSLHDPDARPIAKERLGKPVEFGAKAQLVEGDDGIIVDHNLEPVTPPMHPSSLPPWTA